MPLVKGSSVKLAGAFESAYGSSPGSFVYLPFVSSGLTGQQEMVDNDVLGLGRDAIRPARDIVNVNGSITVPLDHVAIGYWLKLLFGAPTMTGSGPYTHVFNSGADTLPSMHLEFGDAGQYHLYKGVVGNGLQLRAEPTGVATADIELLGSEVTYSGSSAAGTPTTPTYNRFHQFQGTIKKDGSALAKITGVDLRLSNNIELSRYIGGAGAVGDVTPGLFQPSGTIQARLDALTLLSLANAGTTFDLDLEWVSGTTSLKLSYQAAEIAQAGVPFEGPGAVQASFNLISSKSGSNASVKIDLVNGQSAY